MNVVRQLEKEGLGVFTPLQHYAWVDLFYTEELTDFLAPTCKAEQLCLAKKRLLLATF